MQRKQDIYIISNLGFKNQREPSQISNPSGQITLHNLEQTETAERGGGGGGAVRGELTFGWRERQCLLDSLLLVHQRRQPL